MEINLIFKIAAVGILVTILGQVLKHSGREDDEENCGQHYIAHAAGKADGNKEGKRDAEAMLDTAKGRIKVKPSGGIRNYETAKMYVDMGVDRLGTWTYRGGYGTSVAAPDALELWDNIGRNYNRVLKKED